MLLKTAIVPKFNSAWTILFFVVSFCGCGPKAVVEAVPGAVGDFCDPNDYTGLRIPRRCPMERCPAPPDGCRYVHDHYLINSRGNCCPKMCYAVRIINGIPGPCSTPTTSVPTQAPTVQTCDVNLPAFECCVNTDCLTGYSCNTQQNYQCQRNDCTTTGPSAVECCTDSDCASDKVCSPSSNICLFAGYPRFTLTWSVNEDFDLKVETAGGVLINFVNRNDPISGGQLDVDNTGTRDGYKAESIFFPQEKSNQNQGEFRYWVTKFSGRGDASDTQVWQMEVYNGDGLVTRNSGTFVGDVRGDSPIYTYFHYHTS